MQADSMLINTGINMFVDDIGFCKPTKSMCIFTESDLFLDSIFPAFAERFTAWVLPGYSNIPDLF